LVGKTNKMLHFVFDTCSILNIIKIDDDLELLKKLKQVNIYFPEKVKEEIERFIKSTKKQKATDYRNFLFTNLVSYEIIKNNDKDFFEKIERWTSYTKKNGEFFALATAIFLSRYSPKYNFEEQNFIKLITDDSPAQKDFESYLKLEQLVSTGDSIDVMLIFYILDSSFTEGKLKKILLDLKALYVKEHLEIMNTLKELLSKNQSSNKSAKQKLSKRKEIKNFIELYKNNNTDLLLMKIDKLNKLLGEFRIKKKSDLEEFSNSIFRNHIDYVDKINSLLGKDLSAVYCLP